VVFVEQALLDAADVGKSAVIVGAGGAGVESALFVAESGAIDPATQAFLVRSLAAKPEEAFELARRGKPVTLCCRSLKVGSGIGRSTRWTLLRRLEHFGVRTLRGVTYLRIDDRGLTIRLPDGKEETIHAETVLVAAGFDPDPKQTKGYEECAPSVLVIGDAHRVGNIRGAISDAFQQVNRL
jgi:2,4-dienoyl-CoA reductase (NADPH2)